MELTIATASGKELGFWHGERKLDIDVGDTNDFEVIVPLGEWDKNRLWFGTQIYIPGTEFGGIIGDIQTRVKEREVILTGDTWRGLLAKRLLYLLMARIIIQ